MRAKVLWYRRPSPEYSGSRNGWWTRYFRQKAAPSPWYSAIFRKMRSASMPGT
jgi:hypothetical protein